MQLQLTRTQFTDKSTIGELSINGKFECFTLEDVVRPVKIAGETAIPAGTYEVKVSFSPKFNRILPELLDVPNFAGVRIHPGNRAEDTRGCILVGQKEQEDFIGSSKAAFDSLFAKLQRAVKTEEVNIEITEER